MPVDTPKFYTARDVANIFGCCESQAYKIIKKLNDELVSNGKIVVAGKISRRYFDEKAYL